MSDAIVAKIVSEGSHFRAEFTVVRSFKSRVTTSIFPTPRLAKRHAEQKAKGLGVSLVWADDLQREEEKEAAKVESEKGAEYGVMRVKSGTCKKRGFDTLEDAKAYIEKQKNPDNYVASKLS